MTAEGQITAEGPMTAKANDGEAYSSGVASADLSASGGWYWGER